MNLTSDGEKIFEWAEEELNQQITDTIFSKPDVSVESYYEKRNEEGNIIYEYDFTNFEELKGQLVEMWKDDYMQKMILISSVAAMKGRASSNDDGAENYSSDKKVKTDMTIPEYVYVF